MSAVRDSDVSDIVVVGMVLKGTERTGMVLWCIVVVPKSWRGVACPMLTGKCIKKVEGDSEEKTDSFLYQTLSATTTLLLSSFFFLLSL